MWVLQGCNCVWASSPDNLLSCKDRESFHEASSSGLGCCFVFFKFFFSGFSSLPPAQWSGSRCHKLRHPAFEAPLPLLAAQSSLDLVFSFFYDVTHPFGDGQFCSFRTFWNRPWTTLRGLPVGSQSPRTQVCVSNCCPRARRRRMTLTTSLNPARVNIKPFLLS